MTVRFRSVGERKSGRDHLFLRFAEDSSRDGGGGSVNIERDIKGRKEREGIFPRDSADRGTRFELRELFRSQLITTDSIRPRNGMPLENCESL